MFGRVGRLICRHKPEGFTRHCAVEILIARQHVQIERWLLLGFVVGCYWRDLRIAYRALSGIDESFYLTFP